MAIKEEFFIERQGRQMVLFSGLLDEAHTRGLKSIETEEIVVEYGTDDLPLLARFRAVVTMESGQIFTGTGDADRKNVGKNIVPHLIRMAETRAKARALRDAINVGATSLEELGGEDEDGSPQQTRQQSRSGGRQGGSQGRQGQPQQSIGGAQRGAAQAAQGGQNRSNPARKAQVDLLKTLAVEWRGDEGVERLENRIGKPLTELTRGEADEWIERLQPEEAK